LTCGIDSDCIKFGGFPLRVSIEINEAVELVVMMVEVVGLLVTVGEVTSFECKVKVRGVKRGVEGESDEECSLG
jgi:hypothetical protein